MSKRCTHVESNGFHRCGSYAFNLEKDGIEQGDLCDVHYWQDQALSARAKLAEQPAQQEPYGWHTEDHLTDRSATTYSKDMAYRWQCKGWPVTPLYTTPQPAQRKPMTDDELADLWYKQSLDWMEFARAIEAAHGIKENT